LALARYGRGCVFACFAEPIAIALGGVVPSGRHLSVDDVAAAGAQLSRLGFRPVVTD
jgi:predicted amino acid dehydrogenase